MWVFNVFLYLMFLFNQPAYRAFVDSGSPCYTYMPGWGNDDPNAQPVCWYDTTRGH